MQKFIGFLNHPLLHLVIGLLFYLWIGGCIWHLGESFDPISAFLGGLTLLLIFVFMCVSMLVAVLVSQTANWGR